MATETLRSLSGVKPLYKVNDRVQVQQRYNTYGGFIEPMTRTLLGTVTSVGESEYDVAYDWYIVKLDNGEVVESWWMTSYKILGLVEVSGSLSQEAPIQIL